MTKQTITEQEQECLFAEMDVIATENGKSPVWSRKTIRSASFGSCAASRN
jgi:hypothetical protein